MNAKKLISEGLAKALTVVAGSDVPFEVQSAGKLENGDYFTNIALRLAAQLHEKPQDIAYKIKDEFEALGIEEVEKIEIAGPGFVNFFLSEKYLLETLDHIEKKGPEFGTSDKLSNQKTLIEYIDPNPFKELHIGHLYQGVIGEALSRLYESQGAKVIRHTYQGDVGLHVAKAIYGMQELTDEMPDASAPLSDRARFLGRAYAAGAKAYENDAKEEINELNKKIYACDSSVSDLYEKGRAWSLEYFDSIYKRLGTKFEHSYFESEMAEIGAALVKDFLSKGVFEESDGAIIYPGEKKGLHNRVFINSLGLPTYEAKDLGLALTKEKDFAPDKITIITGGEQAEYFKVVLAALSEIAPKISGKTTHIPTGMVRLPTGKMSSRTGDVITGEWLMDEAVARVSSAFPEMEDKIAEKVGLAAIKYALLKSTIGRDIEFSFDESISLEGASGPYLLYTYVRTQSVLAKGHELKKNNEEDTKHDLNSEENAILRILIHFKEVVAEAEDKLSPNILALYLFELAQKFNLFYQKHKIAENGFRLGLTAAVGQTLKNGFQILGIESVEKM